VDERYVVLGLARSRCRWFVELAHWATAAVAPIEFIKCLTAEEARAVMGAGRRVSALLVDGGLSRFDRDIVDAAAAAGAPTILVEDPRSARDWEALGCAAVLDAEFSRDQLVDVLGRWARRVERASDRNAARVDLDPAVCRGRLVAVTGAGGSGTSTVAMALAQAMADAGLEVGLVDGCRRADLAMYHDVGDVIPGLPELVELHRADTADPDQIRSLLFGIDDRGYRLLLGLRRARDWAGLRPRAVEAALDGMRRTHDVVVVDHDADLEREAETGSVDIEDRHAVALATVSSADLVLLVSRPGVKGLHDLARITDDLCRSGLPAHRIVPVVNGAPRSAATRAQLARAVRELTMARSVEGGGLRSPVFIRTVRGLEGRHRAADRLPEQLTRPLARAVDQAMVRAAAAGVVDRGNGPVHHTPERIRPGDLGTRLQLGTTPDTNGPSGIDVRGDVA